MSSAARFPVIPIVDADSQRVVGNFCRSTDVLTDDEVTALTRFREIRHQAEQIKIALRDAPPGTDTTELLAELARLRAEGHLWQERRIRATREKHIALGHTDPALETL
jgi:hypothetical protein